MVTYLDALQAKVDTLKRLQAETAAELGALLPAVLDRAFKGEL
jgi:type I restriction enzyme S subunit